MEISRRRFLGLFASASALPLLGTAPRSASSGSLGWPKSRCYVGYYGYQEAELEAAMGSKAALRRHYFSDVKTGDSRNLLSSATLGYLAGGQIPLISWKTKEPGTGTGALSWWQVANGALDSWANRQRALLLDYLVAHPDARIILCFHHEPTGTNDYAWGGADAYKRAYARLHALIGDHPRLRWAYIVGMPWTSARANEFYPEGLEWNGIPVELGYVGTDPYGNSMTGCVPRGSFRNCARFSGSKEYHVEWARSLGKDLIFAEVGRKNDSAQDEWLEGPSDDMRQAIAGWLPYTNPEGQRVPGVVGFCYFDSAAHCNWTLSAASRQALGRIASDSRFVALA